MTTTPFVRIIIPKGFWLGLHQLNIAAHDVVRKAGLPLTITNEPAVVTTVQYFSLWQAFSDIVADPAVATVSEDKRVKCDCCEHKFLPKDMSLDCMYLSLCKICNDPDSHLMDNMAIAHFKPQTDRRGASHIDGTRLGDSPSEVELIEDIAKNNGCNFFTIEELPALFHL
ncbi:hypothetical protein [Candidatus Pristimantibacillus sp. PTI5]|uniref:hypothetical protein n=1 Tax=Candidatus Pristimantibacillus sp. PTI5 TaxID=3400422 RepID=UPI003B0110FE